MFAWLKNKRKYVAIVLTILISVLYFFLAVQGSFLVDDWGQIDEGRGGLSNQIERWTSLWAIRPVSWIVLPLIIQLLNQNFWAYILIDLILLLGFTYFFVWKSKVPFSKQARYIAIFLCLTPAAASTLVLSPVNQFTAALSLFLFGIGHHLQFKTRNERNNSQFYFVIGFFFYLLSFATYEITLPLVLWNATIAFSNSTKLVNSLKNALLAVMPGFAAILIVVGWQKLFAPHLGATHSRANGAYFENFLPFLKVIGFRIPIELLHFFVYLPAFVVPLGILIFYFIYSQQPMNKWSQEIQWAPYFAGATIGLLSCGALYVASGSAAELFGYGNRGLTSAWVYFSLLLALAASSLPNILRFIVAIICASNFVWFASTVVEDVKASQLRLTIAHQLIEIEKITNVSDSTEVSKDVLLVEVPCRLPFSRSQVEIFCTGWDLKGAVNILGARKYNQVFAGDSGTLDQVKETMGNKYNYVEYQFTPQGVLLTR